MPLRSVEAASRDDAIAAAREQFGPQVRIVGVRRVRSGGVLGFFATERYVAEVAPDVSRPPAPTGVRSSSPLAAASPATAAPSSARPRAAAPARNGAAAYAAEAGTPTPAPRADDAPRISRSEVIARAVAARSVADDDRVSELVGLLGAAGADSPREEEDRPTAARPGYQKASFAKAGWTAALDDDVSEPQSPAAASGSSPSPFTAALARMVAGDRDVQQAVEEALDPAPVRRSEALPARPIVQSPDTAVWPRAARQEEETVGDQVIAPPSMPASAVEVPAWAAPEAPAVPDASRPDEVAAVLRSALAQGHSDEALAGLLRKVLDGASPQVTLPEPVGSEPALPEPMVAEPALPGLVMADNVVAEPSVAPEPAPAVPTVVQDVAPPAAEEPPAPVAEPLFQAAPAPRPMFEPLFQAAPAPRPMFEPLPIPKPPVDIWGSPTSTPLWGAPVLPAPVVSNDAPIWAEIVRAESAVVEECTAPEPAFEPVDEIVEEVVETVLVEEAALVEEVAAVEQAVLVEEAALVEEAVFVEEAALVEGASLVEDAALVEDASLVEEAAEEIVEEVVAETVEETVDETAEEVVVESADEEFTASETPALENPTIDNDVDDSDDEVVAESVDAADDLEATVDTEEYLPAETLVAEEQATEEQATADDAPATESEIAPLLARTASDPAPVGLPMSMSLDATTVMPPLSLLPPLPFSRGRGRPPVPPVMSRPSAPASRPTADEAAVAAPVEPSLKKALGSLATVTRLPVAPLMAGPAFPEISEEEIERLAPETEAPEFAFAVPVTEPASEPVTEAAPVAEPAAAPAPAVELPTGAVVDRLASLGLPTRFLGAGFSADVEALGTYAALTRALGLRLPAAPQLPSGAGDVLFVVGPGVETLRAARSLAASMHLDPDRVQWASRGDLAGLAPAVSRMTTADAAIARRQEAATAGTVTIVAVDVPRRSDQSWLTQLLDIWTPVAVWAVVEATRKPEDVGPWLDDLARVDALIVTDTDLSVDPAAVLDRVAAPVVLLDGVRATPHRWASLLCERLEGAQG